MKALNRSLAQLESAHSTGAMSIWCRFGFSVWQDCYEAPIMGLALGILKDVFARLRRRGKAGLAEGAEGAA